MSLPHRYRERPESGSTRGRAWSTTRRDPGPIQQLSNMDDSITVELELPRDLLGALEVTEQELEPELKRLIALGLIRGWDYEINCRTSLQISSRVFSATKHSALLDPGRSFLPGCKNEPKRSRLTKKMPDDGSGCTEILQTPSHSTSTRSPCSQRFARSGSEQFPSVPPPPSSGRHFLRRPGGQFHSLDAVPQSLRG